MGVASEFDEEEGPLEEHIQRLTDSEKQVEVLKAALEAEKKKSASGDFCQIEKCNRPVDLWCDACETPLCYRCSSKIVCEAAEKHSLEEFDVIYKYVKREFDKWRNNQEEMFVLLEFRQKKMMLNIRGKERELSEASGESLSERADRLSEIADLMKKLEPLSLQVEELKTNLTTYGEDVDKLSKPEYLCVVKSVVVLPTDPETDDNGEDKPVTAPGLVTWISAGVAGLVLAVIIAVVISVVIKCKRNNNGSRGSDAEEAIKQENAEMKEHEYDTGKDRA